MIGKKYSLGSVFEQTGEPLVKLANFDELQNQGQDIKAFIGSFTPDPNFVYLHVIAMSAGEYWGCNINADWFSEADLIARHKTFETQAKVFKEHDNKPTSPSYGKVAFAWYNPKMHRVELLLAIDKIKGKDIIDRQERGEQLCVSMGTRVKYDVCSICGNKSSKPTEYCDHIRFHKKEIFPDGKQAYMINPNPTFFDISIVKKPADKTAYCLAKVASSETVNTATSLSSLGANEFENLDQQIEVESAPIIWEIPEDDELLGSKNFIEAEKVASINKKIEDTLSNIEKRAFDKQVPAQAVRIVNKEIHDLLPAISKIEPSLPDSLLRNLARNFSIKDILRTFLGNAIPMKPEEFTKIIIIQKKLPESSLPYVLKGVLSAPPDPKGIDGIIRPKISSLLEPFLESRSSFMMPVLGRLKSIFSPIGLEKKAASYYKPNPVMEALDLNPALNFGYARRTPEYQDLSGGVPEGTQFIYHNRIMNPIPMAYDQEALAREKYNPSLTPGDKNTLIALGSIIGRDYSAYKNPAVVMSALREPDLLSNLALLLATLRGFNNNGSTTTKKASDASPINNIVLEHLVNSYTSNDELIYDSISDINDASAQLVKEASLKNNVINAAETVLFPVYLARRSAAPLNVVGSIVADIAGVNTAVKHI